MADNFSTNSSGDVPSRDFAADDVTYPPGGAANRLVAPTSLGLSSGSAGSRVFTPIGDTAPLPTKQVAGTATLNNVNDLNTNQTIVAANSSRKGLLIHNDSPELLRLKYGATASSTSFSAVVLPGETWVMPLPIYTGQIDGIWAADSTGAARYTELT